MKLNIQNKDNKLFIRIDIDNSDNVKVNGQFVEKYSTDIVIDNYNGEVVGKTIIQAAIDKLVAAGVEFIALDYATSWHKPEYPVRIYFFNSEMAKEMKLVQDTEDNWIKKPLIQLVDAMMPIFLADEQVVTLEDSELVYSNYIEAQYYPILSEAESRGVVKIETKDGSDIENHIQ